MQHTNTQPSEEFSPAILETASKETLVQAYRHLYEQHKQLQHEFTALTHSYEVEDKTIDQKQYTIRDFVQLLNSTSEIIFTLDRQHVVLLNNVACTEHFLQMYGVDLKIGDRLDHIFDEEEQAYWHPIFDLVFAGKPQKSILQKNINGSVSYLETMLYPVLDSKGEVNSIGVFCRDITENQLIEQAIRENEQNLSDAHRIAKSGSWEYNIQKQNVTLSRETVALFGLPQLDEQLTFSIQEVLLNFIYPDDLLHFLYRLSIAMQYRHQPEKYRDQFEYRFIRPDGEVRHLVLYAHFKHNQPDIIYGVTRDITQQKEIEKRLIEQNDELTKVNSEIDRFVYRVSHDLRAPIASILGLINIARYETSLDKIMEYLTLQEKSILKIDGFIQEIIDFSKNSRLQISKSPIDFQLLAKEVFEAQTHEPNIRRVMLQVTVNQQEAFVSDRERIFIILNNLVVNAIRYANLNQQESYVKITVRISTKEAMIIIKDNGIGIHEKHINNVFDMFYRANDINPGSGLGLYIAKETIRKLHGHIELSSKLGEGTCFKVTLPNLDHSFVQ